MITHWSGRSNGWLDAIRVLAIGVFMHFWSGGAGQ